MQKPYPIYDQNGRNQLKLIPYLWPAQPKNHTLWGRTYLYSRCKGLPPPPGGVIFWKRPQKWRAWFITGFGRCHVVERDNRIQNYIRCALREQRQRTVRRVLSKNHWRQINTVHKTKLLNSYLNYHLLDFYQIVSNHSHPYLITGSIWWLPSGSRAMQSVPQESGASILDISHAYFLPLLFDREDWFPEVKQILRR